MSNVLVFAFMSIAMISVLVGFGGEAIKMFDDLSDSWFDHQDNAIEQLDIRIRRTSDTPVTGISSVQLNWKNEGSVPLTQFSDWDVIVEIDENPGVAITRLTHSTSTIPGSNQWTVQGIYVDASSLTPEVSDPKVLNPGEEMVVLINPDGPQATKNRFHRLTFVSPTGYEASAIFYAVSPNLVFHSETTEIGGTTYYSLQDGVTANGSSTTISSSFSAGQTGRVRPSSNNGKFAFSLATSTSFATTTWDVTYRIKHDGLGFTWFTNAFDISLSSTGSWRDIDVSPLVPAGASGIVVEVVNVGSTPYSGVLRGKADTRDYMSDPDYQELRAEGHRWQIVQLDGGRVAQGYIEHVDIDFKLLGYTVGSDPSYFGQPGDITPGTTGAWTTVDVSGQVDADADGVILLIDSVGSNPKAYGVREFGSSYSTTTRKIDAYGNTAYLVGIDGSDRFEVFIEDTNVKFYLIGQTKGSVVYYTDDRAVADPATGSWAALDADDYVPSSLPASATGLVYYVANNDGSNPRKLGLRNASSTDDWPGDMGPSTHMQAASGMNGINAWEAYMEDTSADVYIAAYTRSGRMDVHADIDVLIRESDGSIRATLSTDSADSANITGAGWRTMTGSLGFPGYTVEDQTDYLEIDLHAEATANTLWAASTVDFYIDGLDIPPLNQTHVQERYTID